MIRSIKTIMRQDREPYRIPRRVQDVIPIQCVWPDGIFKVGIKFSKTYRFTDINYKVAGQEDKMCIRDRLKALMNNAPCRFAISNELPEGVNVTYHPQEHTVHVRQGLDAPTIFRGLAQELARAHMDRDGITCESPDFTAYSVSYICLLYTSTT